MTTARRLRAGQLHFVTRRCTQRKLLLTPTEPVNQVVRFALAVATERFKVRVCAVVASTNHIHLVVEDPDSELGAFMRDVDQLIARALNAHYGRRESLWRQPDSYNNVELNTREKALAKLVYLYANPTADRLVEHPDLWPGVITRPEDMGVLREQTPRPEQAFFGGRRPPGHEPTYRPGRLRWPDPNRRPPEPKRASYRERPSTLPEQAPFEVHVPSMFADLPREAFHRLVRDRLEHRVAEIRAEFARARLSFMGRERVRRQQPESSPGAGSPDFALTPHLAGRENASPEEKAELVAWRAAYREAYLLWRAGRRKTTFPRGTYGMRVYHAALVDPP